MLCLLNSAFFRFSLTDFLFFISFSVDMSPLILLIIIIIDYYYYKKILIIIIVHSSCVRKRIVEKWLSKTTTNINYKKHQKVNKKIKKLSKNNSDWQKQKLLHKNYYYYYYYYYYYIFLRYIKHPVADASIITQCCIVWLLFVPANQQPVENLWLLTFIDKFNLSIDNYRQISSTIDLSTTFSVIDFDWHVTSCK